MVPAIALHARVSFWHLDPDNKQEAVAECLANAATSVAFEHLRLHGCPQLLDMRTFGGFGANRHADEPASIQGRRREVS